MRNLTLILCALFATFQLTAQETDQEVKRFKITSFAIGFGGHFQQLPRLSVSDFKTLAPESILLSNDLGDFSPGFSGNGPGGGSITALLEISKRNKDKTAYSSGPIFRVGINFLGRMGVTNNILLEQRTPYDTLYSGNSGIITYVDSVREQRYEMNYRSNHLQLDLSAIWRSKSKSLLSLYAGVGVSAGFSVFTETTINYFDNRFTSQYQSGNNIQNSSPNEYNSEGVHESVMNTQNFAIQMFMPLGVALKLGKKRELFRNLHLFTELRPGIAYYQIPELNAGYTRFFYQQLIGFRYQVD